MGLGVVIALGGIAIVVRSEEIAADNRKNFGEIDDPRLGPKGALENFFLDALESARFMPYPRDFYMKRTGSVVFMGVFVILFGALMAGAGLLTVLQR